MRTLFHGVKDLIWHCDAAKKSFAFKFFTISSPDARLIQDIMMMMTVM